MKTKTQTSLKAEFEPAVPNIRALRRRQNELEQRLKGGTLEQAVDFFNRFGHYARPGVTTTELANEYLSDLEGHYVTMAYVRYCAHKIGCFVKALPGQIDQILPMQIDTYLQALNKTPRVKNDSRAVLVAFFHFAQQKGCLPYSMPHAASLSNKFVRSRNMMSPAIMKSTCFAISNH